MTDTPRAGYWPGRLTTSSDNPGVYIEDNGTKVQMFKSVYYLETHKDLFWKSTKNLTFFDILSTMIQVQSENFSKNYFIGRVNLTNFDLVPPFIVTNYTQIAKVEKKGGTTTFLYNGEGIKEVLTCGGNYVIPKSNSDVFPNHAVILIDKNYRPKCEERYKNKVWRFAEACPYQSCNSIDSYRDFWIFGKSHEGYKCVDW